MAVVSATASAEKAAPERDDRAAKRYEQLATERQPYLDRARECARLTIPSIMPEEGHTGANRLYKPWSSVGADCVNNLAAKLLLALFPPGTPFFRLAADPFILEDLMAATGGQEDVEGELEKAFGKIERTVSDHMESTGARKVHFETILHLIVTGNGLQHVNNEGKIKFFPLDRYEVALDLDDNVLEIIGKETVARVALPDKIREIVDRHNAPTAETVQRNIDVYTWVRREKNQWRVHQ